MDGRPQDSASEHSQGKQSHDNAEEGEGTNSSSTRGRAALKRDTNLPSLEEDRQIKEKAAKERSPGDQVSAMTVMDDRICIADTSAWCFVISVEVLANVACFALEADLKCRHNCVEEDFALWRQLDLVFTLVGLADVLFAAWSFGPRVYFMGDPVKVGINTPRVLDSTLVFLRCLDVFLLQNNGVKNSGLRYLTSLRVIHIAHFTTKMQLISGFRELWLIMNGMMDTMRTVLWVVGLFVLVLWVGAVLVAMAVSSSDGPFDYSKANWSVDDYWGTVPKCIWSLLQVMTRDKWSSSAVWPLVEASNSMIFLFVGFLCVAVFALLNTIIGVVVESTLRSARENEEKEAKLRAKADFKLMESLQAIFEEADEDGNGELTLEELHTALKTPRVKKSMSLLGIPVGDLDLLFTLLDEDGQGRIQASQFFRGCTRLRGPAMARDLHYISVDLDRNVQSATRQIKTIRSLNDNIATILDTIDTIEVDIVQDESDEKDPVLVSRRGHTRVSKASLLRTNTTGETDERSDAGSERGRASIIPSAELPGPRPKGALSEAVAARRAAGASPTSPSEGHLAKKKWLEETRPNNPAPPPIPAHLINRLGTSGSN